MKKAALTKEQRVVIGNRIRTRRKRLGLSQEQLAALSGLSLSYLQKVETGQKGTRGALKTYMALMENHAAA